jgi:hypothetical protein
VRKETNALVIIMLLVVGLSACGGRSDTHGATELDMSTPEASRRVQFATVDDFFACRRIRGRIATSAAMVDYIGSLDLRGSSQIGVYDAFWADEDLVFPVAGGDYDVYALRVAPYMGECDDVACLLILRHSHNHVRRWEGPTFGATDNYAIAITTPAGIDRLVDWENADGQQHWNSVVVLAEVNWLGESLPGPPFLINASRDSHAIVVRAGKVLECFRGFDADGKIVALMVNVF